MLYVLRAEVVRQWGELHYYWLNYLAGAVLNLILFAGLFYAVTRGSDAESITVLNLLVAYLIWYYTSDFLSEMSTIVLEEALLGTLEQIYISQTSIFVVLLARAAMSLARTSLFVVLFLGVVLPSFGVLASAQGLSATDWVVLVGICVVAMIAAVGLGFALFGLSILFKRIGAVKAIIDYTLLVFSGVFLSVKEFPFIMKAISSFLPYTWALECLRLLVTQRVPATDILSRTEALAALAVAAAYLVGGALIARWCLNAGRRRGALAHY